MELHLKKVPCSVGEMEALAKVPRTMVIATYTEVPPLPPKGSSGVCRVPIAQP